MKRIPTPSEASGRRPRRNGERLRLYTHRVGLSNHRIVSIDEQSVTFRTKNGRTTTLDGVEFLRRFINHRGPP